MSIFRVLGSGLYKWTATATLLFAGCNLGNKTNPEIETNENKKFQLEFKQSPNTNFELSKNSKKILDEADRRLDYLRERLFEIDLLELIDELDDIYRNTSFLSRGLVPQELLSRRLTEEVFPILWHKVLKEEPDEVIVGSFSELGNIDNSTDFGRGQRVILRKQIGRFNISTIMFLDYSEKTGKLEFPQDFFLREKPNMIYDSMRMLIEYNANPSEQAAVNARKSPFTNINLGFFGTTISTIVDPEKQSVTDLIIYPTRDLLDEPPTIIGLDKTIPIVSFWQCTSCHHQAGQGFIVDFSPHHKTMHLHQEDSINKFLDHVREKKRFESTEERDKQIKIIREVLSNPKENLHSILPTGLMDSLERKQKGLSKKSVVLKSFEKQ